MVEYTMDLLYYAKYADYLDAEKECLTNPAGNSYHGTKTRAASGRPCMNWMDVTNYAITASLTDINEARNFCRRVPFTEWNGPSCVTTDEVGVVRLERCDVRYCGTLSGASLCHYTVCLKTIH